LVRAIKFNPRILFINSGGNSQPSKPLSIKATPTESIGEFYFFYKQVAPTEHEQ